MYFSELVKKRNSTRKYSPRPVPRELIDRCLEAARMAPSACNSQPWHFIVIDDNKLKDALCKAAFSGIYSINSSTKQAPVLIVAITERDAYITRVGGYLRGMRYSLIDIGIACEHLVLQAAEEGIGTCWLGWFDEKRVKKILGISKRKKIDVMISMGYPAEGRELRKARRPLSEIRTFCT